MNRALVSYIYRKVLPFRHTFPVFLFFLISFSAHAQCPPVIHATPSPSSVCAGDSVLLACSPSTGTTWQWFRDGQILADETNNTCAAYIAGSYTVVTGSCVTPSDAVSVSIKPLPVLSLSSSSKIICSGQTVTFTVSTGPNVIWVWITPPSLLGTVTNPVTLTLTASETFQIVGVDQTTNCANSTAVTIIVQPVLVPAYIQSNAQICPGETPPEITISVPAIGGSGNYTYQWQISSTSAPSGFTDIPGATGLSYQPGPAAVTAWYRLVTKSPPCEDVYSNPVVVQVNANPTITSLPKEAICTGASVNYHPTSSVPGTTFTWTASLLSGIVTGFSPSGNGDITDVLSLPNGSTTSGEVLYIITPEGPAPTSCSGTILSYVVSVHPIPLVTNAILAQDVCAGTFTAPVVLESNIASATFSWTATATPGLSGYQVSGTGDIPSMQVFSSLFGAGNVNYTITPHGQVSTCPIGPPVVYVIHVNPSPSVTNDPMKQTICTATSTAEVILLSNVPSTTFTWTATATPASVTGYLPSGTNTIPAQIITNPTNIQGVVTFHILPSGSLNGCVGVPGDYIVYVNPKPVALATPSAVTICSGQSTSIALTSSVFTTTYNWTASGPPEVTGFSNNSGNIIAQTLINSSNDLQNVTYVVTPVSFGCEGVPVTAVVTVAPTPSLTTTPLLQTICSGSTAIINLTGTPANAAFTWTATGLGVTGFSNGAGNIISQTLTNTTNNQANVLYTINVSANGCTIPAINYTVTVNPKTAVTNNPLAASRCSGTAFNLALTSNVAGTTYTWIANGTPGLSGYADGSGGIINQTINNSSFSQGTVVYTITPTANGCPGAAVNYTLTVNPVPDVSLSIANQSICSGTSTTAVIITSSVSGTSFTWTATPSGGGITGYTASGSGSIPSQIINNTLSVQGTVSYMVTTSFNGCSGSNALHLVTINPRPVVTNIPMFQAICTGATTTNVSLIADVPGTSFSWTATPSSPDITGYKVSGGSTIPPQTIFNSSATPGTVTYEIFPRSNFGPFCVGTTANYVITINPLPSITSSLSEAVCSGQAFDYIISSNLPGTTFNWSRAFTPGITNASASGATASISETLINTTNTDIDVQYILTPTGAAPTLCTGNASILSVKVRALPQVSAGTSITIPYGIYTTLNGTVSGGSGTLTYGWTPISYIGSGAGTLVPQTTNLYSNRTFKLTATDAAGCTSNDQVTVFVVGSPITAFPTAAPAAVCLGASSIINANATGGSGSYSYSWSSVPAGFSSAAATITVTPVETTEYFITVNDGFNTATSSVTLTVNPLPLSYVLTGGGSYCTGGTGNTVGLAGSQSGVNYQLYINGILSGSPISGTNGPISFGNQTTAGTYTAIATRVSTGCVKAMGSSVVVSINLLPVAEAGPDQLIPYGTNTSFNGSVSGGSGMMSYAWNPNAFIASGANSSSPITTNLYSSTTFTLMITDGNGCVGTDQVLVSLQGNAVTAFATASPDHICADTSHTQLNAMVSGGTGIYSYVWTSIPAGIPAWTSTLQNPLVSPDVTTTYTVTADDGFNSAIASVSIVVYPLPLQYSVTGGGSYCYGGVGVNIGLSGSELYTNYQLYRSGIIDGSPVTGTGNPISFGNRTTAFTYTVVATNNLSGCINLMTGSASINIVSPPTAYLVTGGGSYPLGGPGRIVGLFYSNPDISYQLNCNNSPIGSPVAGVDGPLNFGLQTQQGTYTVTATDLLTGCSVEMNGSVNITILAIPALFDVTGGGSFCFGEPGVSVGLTGSEVGVNYQLLYNGFPQGGIVAGSNMPLFWGPFTSAGLYEVRATNSTYGATLLMEDSAVIIVNPLPTLYTVSPSGAQCPGTSVGINGSDSGVTYYLMINGNIVDSRPGTGLPGFIDFGPQTMNGTYTVKAVNTLTTCEDMMNGSTYINVSMQLFSIIPAGILCPGQPISLAGSESGVNYQLRRNGTFNVGSPISGTGSAIPLGSALLPGTYSVIAINATTGCVAFMNDSATLYPDPTAFTMVPDGAVCEGSVIGLNGSEPGVKYVLLLDNVIHIDTITGNGLPIDFGAQLTAGNYTVIAVDNLSHCQFTMNGTTILNENPVKFAVLPAGIQCVGSVVELSGSQTGVSYQLMLNGLFSMGAPLAGNGNAIAFGYQSLNGIYTVRAVNDITGCNTEMNDSAVLQPLPGIFSVTPAGNHCAGTPLILNGSELNFNYILVFNGSINLDTIAGNGSIIDFGPQSTAGSYSVTAYNAVSLCSGIMNGITVIEAAPVSYNLTPAGFVCQGTSVGLENSQTGVTYQLRLNGLNSGIPVSGTGSAISFGSQSLTGIYTVIATGNNGCTAGMNLSLEISSLPKAYTVTPSGINCANSILGLNGSDAGIKYVLILDGIIYMDTLTGTGTSINFGAQIISGTYTVLAYNPVSQCQKSMTGSSVISPAPLAFNMTPAGFACPGTLIGLENSETGINYQLRRDAINTGNLVAGTGAAIDFGAQTLAGTYTVIAIAGNNCFAPMNGNIVIDPSPVAYTITPSGNHCPGTLVGLNGSGTGINYILILDGSILVDTLAGTGAAISFGAQLTAGSYTVLASNATTLCQSSMNGTSQIIPAPIAFNLTPAGIICTGTAIGLDNSETGVAYQLRRDGLINIGMALTGTGLPLSFGVQTVPGTYTVEAVGNNSCTAVMSGSIVMNTSPALFTQFPAGSHCPGTAITLNGSENGVSYILFRDGLFPMDTLAGTGSVLNFGSPVISGTYTISAYSTASMCLASMNGSTTLLVSPTAFNVTPAGINCSGSSVGLFDSETGVSYQLFRDGITNVGAPVAGTGSALSFGIINIPGTYTVTATSTLNGCITIMTGNAILQPMPLIFTITPQGTQCAGTSITLNGSQSGIDYVLLRDNSIGTDTVAGTGSVISFGSQLITGLYTIEAIGGISSCQAIMTGFVQIVALPADFNLTPAGLICASAHVGIDGSETGVSYTLFNNNITTGMILAGTGNALDFGLYTHGDYTVKAVNQTTNCSTFMSGTIQISFPLAVNAGADISTCENVSFLISDASASPFNTLNWISSGTGAFDNAAIINPTYTPGIADLTSGAVTLTLTASNTGCGSVSDSKAIFFINHTDVNAGPDVTICEGGNSNITGATANAYSSLIWTTSGTGTFVNGNTLSPIYTPGAADITNGSVTLTLSAVSLAPCTNVISDQIVLTIHAKPLFSAGSDALICSTETFMNNDANALNCATLTWTTSGTGTFSDAGSLLNIYTPGISDLAAGSVLLTLTTSNNFPCSDVSDQKILSFLTAPTVNAGPSTTICNTCSFVASGATATNATTIGWSTSGSGTFGNATAVNTTYIPSAADYMQGSVILSLKANTNAPCNAVTDTLTLSFTNVPGVEFSWGPACEVQPVTFTVNPVITNIGAMASWLWNFGDGGTSVLMNPTHLFAALGQYTVTLTCTDTSGNAKTVSHTVSISLLPVAFFSYSTPNCSNQPVILTDLSHTLYGYISEWIWNYGDGSANDTIYFPNEPNVSHQFSGPGVSNVTLTVTNSFGCMAMNTMPVEVTAAPTANYTYANDCSGLETSFLDASSANGSGNTVQYWWNFGDPATGLNNKSEIKDAVHLFSNPGTYQVMHVVRNFNNCADTIVKSVIIRMPVIVGFIYDHTCLDGNAHFSPDTTVMNIAAVSSWAWDFGDGVTDFQQNTVHAYQGPGSYQVTLTVTDFFGCTASKTRTVVVNPLPLALFNTSQLPCQNIPAQFDDVSTTYAGFITRWEWNFGDGNNQTIHFPVNGNVSHNYAAAGIYTVTLTITSSDSCQAVHTQTITVEPAPTANFEFLSSCQNSAVQFNNLSQTGGTGSITSNKWNFGDEPSGGNNTSTIQNPVHTFTSTGTYQVSLLVSTANGCWSTLVKSITITEAPFVDFSFDSHCQNSSIQFTPATGIISSAVATWYWSFGDGFTSALPNPQHTYLTPGNHTVTLTITNTFGCQSTVSHFISILSAPVANFNTNAPACSQHQVNFISQSYAPAGYIMRWVYNFGDGNSTVINFPGNPNVSHTYTTYGFFNATLTVITNDSCSATAVRTVEILQSPLANFDYAVSCAGAPVQFTDLSQGSMVSWQWNFGETGSGAGNTSSVQNPLHTYPQPGNFIVTLLVQNANGCNDTVSRTVTILPKPVVDFSFNNGCAADTVHFNSSAFVNVSNTSSWFWQFGDNNTSSAADPDHVYTSPGTYAVTLTVINQNGCSNLKTYQVHITAAPIAFFSSVSQACSGTAVTFNESSSTLNGIINTWNWSFGDGTFSTITAPANPDATHTYASAGVYTVTLTIHTSTGCEAYYSTSLTINDASAAAFSYTGSCNGALTLFNDLTQAAGGNNTIGWAWEFGDPNSGINNTSALPSPEHFFSVEGTYTVSLTVENTTGCLSTVNQTLIISPKPAVDFLVSGSCLGLPVSLSADPAVTNIAGIATYLWNFGDGSAPSALATPEHTYTDAGSYLVTLTITNLSGCQNTVSHTITVHALPVAQFSSTGNCASNLVQFTDISYNPDGEAITGWNWDFGVNNSTADTSKMQNPTYTYTSAGIRDVTLIITSASGCNDVNVMPLTVIPAPAAHFSYVAEPCHNGSVVFKDESISLQSEITNWYWEFTPGVYSTLANPVHVFGKSDTCYQVKLVVTNANGCTDTLISEVCIPSGMEVALAYTQTCFGENTWFIPTLVKPAGGSIAYYKWDFGDPVTGINNTSEVENPQHTFSKSGTFVVALQAIDINNCSTTTYLTITVSPLPKAAFSHAGGNCDNLVSFKDLTTNASISRWIWDFGDGNMQTIDAPQTPETSHNYPFPGIYEVSLVTLSTGGCSDTITETIRRTPCIASEFAVTDAVICQKRTMRFTESSTCQAPIASWQWSFGDNTSAVFTTPQAYIEHAYTVAGTYTVRMVVATQMVGGLVTDTSSRQVIVKPAAIASYKWQDACIGGSTVFQNISQPNNTIIQSYFWNFGDPASLTDTTSLMHPEYRYNLYGQYDVKLVVTNTIGCTDTIVNKVNVFRNPSADFTWNSSCVARPVFFTDNSDTSSSFITAWNWIFSSAGEVLGASTDAKSNYSFGHAGIYDADLKITDRNGCIDSVRKQVAINSSPTAKFSMTENYDDKPGEILMNNETENGTNYAWDFGNGETSSSMNPVVTFDKEGHYEIQLITWNGQNCTDTTTLKYELMFKGLFVPNAFSPGDLNPEVAVFRPKGTNLKNYFIEIYDRLGNLLWSSGKLDSSGSPSESWDGTLHGNDLKQDVYLWKISAQFRDGKAWDGHNSGKNDNMPQSKVGTVTLIR